MTFYKNMVNHFDLNRNGKLYNVSVSESWMHPEEFPYRLIPLLRLGML